MKKEIEIMITGVKKNKNLILDNDSLCITMCPTVTNFQILGTKKPLPLKVVKPISKTTENGHTKKMLAKSSQSNKVS